MRPQMLIVITLVGALFTLSSCEENRELKKSSSSNSSKSNPLLKAKNPCAESEADCCAYSLLGGITTCNGDDCKAKSGLFGTCCDSEGNCGLFDRLGDLLFTSVDITNKADQNNKDYQTYLRNNIGTAAAENAADAMDSMRVTAKDNRPDDYVDAMQDYKSAHNSMTNENIKKANDWVRDLRDSSAAKWHDKSIPDLCKQIR